MSTNTNDEKIRIVDLESGDETVNITDSSHVMMIDSQSTGSKKLTMTVLLNKILAYIKANPSTALPNSIAGQVLVTDANNTIKWANKETQVNADWEANSGVARILNKPNLSQYVTNTTLESALETVNESVTAEAAARHDADEAINTAVAGVSASLTDNVATLNNTITTKENALKAADTALQTAITAEESARTAADTALSDRVDATNAEVAKTATAWVFKGSKSASDISGLTELRNGDVYQVSDNGTISGNAVKAGDIVAYYESSWIHVSHALVAQAQADWNQDNSEAVDYIKNKPANIVQDENYIHTDNNFTTAHKTLVENAVQSSELATVATSGSYDDLEDKPTIPTVPTNVSAFENDANYLTATNIENKAEKSEMGISAISGDNSKKNIQLKTGLNTDVVVEHQDISGKAEKSELTISAVSGDNSKKNIQLKNGTDVDVVVEHQDISGKQDVINDLADIRSKANAAYIKDANGIPKTDLASAVQTSLGKADTAIQSDDLATVATSGDYDDLANKPSLATVATSGSYNDLSNKPTIPAAQVQADYAQTDDTAVDYIKNKPALFSGSYNDLTNKPDLTVYAESSTLATVATSGSYNDLSNKPTIPAAQVNADWNADSGVSAILNKPTIPEVYNYTASGSGLIITQENGVKNVKVENPVPTNGSVGNVLKKTASGTEWGTVSVPVTDVTVNGTSVVSNGTAAIPAIPDVSGKAEKSEMSVSAVSGDATKKTVTLKNGLSVDVVTEHKAELPTEGKAEGKVLTINNSDEVIWGDAQGGTVLPQYDSSNAGMVLTVGYIGSSLQWKAPLPEYDEEDAGKILSVNVRTIEGVEVAETAWIDPPKELPATTGHNSGDVLTFDGTNVGWAAPSGGGGGGNPYTKVAVTPGQRYANGQQSEYNTELMDQDVTIANNTYSVLPAIGYEESDYPTSETVYNLNIKLPANTEFPMCVVEFDLTKRWAAAVSYIRVFVGSTELTRMYDSPYNENLVVADSDGNIDFGNGDSNGIKHITDYGQNYWRLPTVDPNYMIKNFGAFVYSDTDGQATFRVQVHIFGNSFRVTTNFATSEVPAS